MLAFKFAIYALPVMAGISVFQFVYAADLGFSLSALAALGMFATPAAVAGYALAHGVAKHALESEFALHLMCGTCGLIVASAVMINLSALDEDVLPR